VAVTRGYHNKSVAQQKCCAYDNVPWMNLQANYDLELAEDARGSEFPAGSGRVGQPDLEGRAAEQVRTEV
jgi:hypothetical protein